MVEVWPVVKVRGLNVGYIKFILQRFQIGYRLMPFAIRDDYGTDSEFWSVPAGSTVTYTLIFTSPVNFRPTIKADYPIYLRLKLSTGAYSGYPWDPFWVIGEVGDYDGTNFIIISAAEWKIDIQRTGSPAFRYIELPSINYDYKISNTLALRLTLRHQEIRNSSTTDTLYFERESDSSFIMIPVSL